MISLSSAAPYIVLEVLYALHVDVTAKVVYLVTYCTCTPEFYIWQAIANTGRPMVYSVSPGEGVTPTMGQAVAQLVNMYRVSLDNWDNWNSLQPHFDISRSSLKVC